MDDAPPQKGDGVGQIRKTKHSMGLGGLFSSLFIENKLGLDISSQSTQVEGTIWDHLLLAYLSTSLQKGLSRLCIKIVKRR